MEFDGGLEREEVEKATHRYLNRRKEAANNLNP